MSTSSGIAKPHLVAVASPALAPVRNFDVPGPYGRIPVRLHAPAGTAHTVADGQQNTGLPLLLYFHGGGFVGGTLDDADVPARFFAVHCQALVLAVGYSLAPARPFPAAPEDAYAAAVWMAEHAGEFGVDAQRMAAAGDDAGGALTAALVLMSRDRNTTPMLAQALISPMLDPSMTRLGDEKRLESDTSAEICADCYRQYLPTSMQRLHPYAAPLESRRLAGLPPAFIASAGRDVLCNEAENYAAALIAAGVRTQVARFAGVTHRALRTHLPALREVAEFLQRKLHAGAAALPFQYAT